MSWYNVNSIKTGFEFNIPMQTFAWAHRQVWNANTCIKWVPIFLHNRINILLIHELPIFWLMPHKQYIHTHIWLIKKINPFENSWQINMNVFSRNRNWKFAEIGYPSIYLTWLKLVLLRSCRQIFKERSLCNEGDCGETTL